MNGSCLQLLEATNGAAKPLRLKTTWSCLGGLSLLGRQPEEGMQCMCAGVCCCVAAGVASYIVAGHSLPAGCET